MEKFILKTIAKITVKTDYDNGQSTANEVIHNSAVEAVNKSLAVDEKNLGRKIARCKKAIHTVIVDGEELSPQIETIFN